MNELFHLIGTCPDHSGHVNLLDILCSIIGPEYTYSIRFVKIYFLNLIKCIKNNC